jgi:hypothetical protein
MRVSSAPSPDIWDEHSKFEIQKPRDIGYSKFMTASDRAAQRQAGAAHLSTQARWCHGLGSPLYGYLLERAAEDCERGGLVWSILEPQADEPLGAAVALRFMGAVHRLVLQGEAAPLARHYPSAGGEVGRLEDVWDAFQKTLSLHGQRLRALSRAPVQTNEVGRSAALLGGFLEIARRTALPLRLLEIGSSAGLNLRWDHYRYDATRASWGDPRSPVRFSPAFEDAHPSLDVRVEIQERRGCDPLPLDPSKAKDRTTLRAYLWPDQTARQQRLDGALEIAQRVPAEVETASAADWLATHLGRVHTGVATVVFHSIMMQYVAREERSRATATLREAGQRATARAPLAWLRFEPAKDGAGNWIHRVDLTVWPEGDARLLATCSPHGPPVKWLDDSPEHAVPK